MPIVDARRISFNFGSNWALKDISFALNEGDYMFLSGPSGAGKTTLLRMLYGDIDLARGTAEIAGFPLKGLKPRQLPLLRRDVSFVFQDFKILPHRTVYENVAIALVVRNTPVQHIDRRVRAVLRSMELEPKIDSLCGRLSGGEQQRVAIARAIVTNPKVLLADEPTGNLDPDLALRLMQVFNHFNSYGTTIIFATHSRALLKCQTNAKIMQLTDGAITFASWPGAVISRTEAPA